MKGSAAGLLTVPEAAAFAADVRRRGGTVVFTNGVFDLLHPGHIRYLQDARRLGAALIVGLNSDRSLRERAEIVGDRKMGKLSRSWWPSKGPL